MKTDLQGNIIWQNCLGGSRGEFPNNIFWTNDNGFTIFGLINSDDGDVTGFHGSIGNAMDVWVVKIDSAGQVV